MNFNLVAAVNGSGYGIVGFKVLEALNRAGCDVAFFPRHVSGPELSLELDEVAMVMRCIKAQRTMDMDAPCLRISSEDDLTLFAGRGPRGGLVRFETTAFTDVELRHLHALDILFVATGWAREIAIANGLPSESVLVAPDGVDRALFTDADPPVGERTVFFHAGAWQHRKGQDAILDAFGKAFRPGDRVELQMLCDNPWSAIDQSRWYDLCRASPMADHITILPRQPTLRDVVALMQRADCGVFPARGEAWNLEALEMMSCGRPIIATDFAGHTEFVTPENAMLIEIDELEPAEDPVWNSVYTRRKTGEWAHLGDRQIEQLVAHMRDVHARKQAGEVLRNDAGIATAERFSWDHTVACILEGFG